MGLFSKLGHTKARDTGPDKTVRANNDRRYTAVEVISDLGNCCDAVRKIAGERFLTEDAPILPLPNCSRPKCRCKYLHYTDRRTDLRRDADIGVGLANHLFHGQCRRSNGRGRRKTDRDPE